MVTSPGTINHSTMVNPGKPQWTGTVVLSGFNRVKNKAKDLVFMSHVLFSGLHTPQMVRWPQPQLRQPPMLIRHWAPSNTKHGCLRCFKVT